MKDTIVLRSSTLLSEVSPHFNYPDQVSQYFSDTYGENHIVFKTTETLGNYEKHVVVLKFDQCGVANRVKQRYNGRVLFHSRITTTFLDARQVEELGLDKDKVATSLSTSKKKKKLQPVQKEQEEWMYRHGLLEEEEEEEKVKLKYEMLFFSEENESAHFDQSYESYDTILSPAIPPEDSTYTKDHYSRNTADLDNDDQDTWTYYRTKKERDRRRKDRSYEKERDRSSERHRRHRSSSSTSSSHTAKKDTSSRSSRKRYREDRTDSYNSSRSQSQSLSDDMTQDSMLQRDTSYPNYSYDYSEQYYCSESQDYAETDSTGLLSQDSTEWVEYYGSNPIIKEEPTNDDCEDEDEDSDNNGQIKQVSFVLGDCLAMLRQDTSSTADNDKSSKESVDKKDKTRHSSDSKRHKKSRESRHTSSERDHHKRKRSYSEQDLESDEGSKELQPPKKVPKSRKDDSRHSKDHHQKSNESSPPEKEESVKSKLESSPLKKDDSTKLSRSKETVSKIDSSSQEKSTQKKDHQKKEEHVKRHSTGKTSKEDSSRSSKEHGSQSSKTEEMKKDHTSKTTSSQPVKHSSTQSQTKEAKKDSESGKTKKDEKSLPTRDDSSQETNTSSKENSKQELSLIPKKNESKESNDNSKNDVISQVSMVTTPTNTMTTTTQPILAGPPNIGSITTPSIIPGPLATMVPTLASTPLVTPTSVATPSTTPTPTVPIMVPIYLPCTPEYQQMLLTHYQQLALTNPSASLWPYPVEDNQQFTRSRSGTPVMDETEEVHPATTTTPIVENKQPSSTSDLPIPITCINELQQTQSTTYTSTKINNQLQSAPISQISVTQSADTAQFTQTNSTITSSVITTPPIALIPMPVTQSNGNIGSVEPSNKPFVSEPNNITIETQFDSVDSSATPITNIPSVSYDPAISDSFIADVSPHTQPLDPNVIQTPDMQEDEEESIIENPPSPLSLKRIDPDVNFKKYKSETMKEYWEQAKIMLASTKVLASVSDPNQSMDITASLEKSLQLVARNLLTNFRKRTGIMEDTIV